jgi:hypothetical protein
LPLIARYFIRRTAKKFNQEYQQPKANRKSGEIHVDKKPDKKTVSENLGEYIDYEEVDD